MIIRDAFVVDRLGASRTMVLVLRRQFWVIALIVSVGALSSLAYSRMQAPNYEASAVLQVRPGVDVAAAKARLTSRRNLLDLVMRHHLSMSGGEANLGRSAVMLRQSIGVHDLTSDAGVSLGFDPEVAGIVVTVLLPDPEMSARIANDLAQQLLDVGNAGALGPGQEELLFYRREELRLWQETSALQGELDVLALNDSAGMAQGLAQDRRRLVLMQDQYDLVRHRLAEFEIAARLADMGQANQFSLLQRATATEAVGVLRNWMLVGVAGSLLLAVALAFVLDRRYPGLQRGPWDDFAKLRFWFGRIARTVDDPSRPILGVPRYVVISAALVVCLIGSAALLR